MVCRMDAASSKSQQCPSIIVEIMLGHIRKKQRWEIEGVVLPICLVGMRKIDSCILTKQSLMGGLIAAYRKQLGGKFQRQR